MANVLNEESRSYDKEKDSFLQELLQFHETRGTPCRRTPKINGYEIDLNLLYNLVTARGGWLKVNSRNEWEKILSEFNIPKQCVNAGVAIKQIYLRYLDRYEKMHFLGEVGERAADDEDSRHKRWSARAFHAVPLSYNHSQHNFNESLRDYNGLSVNLYRDSEYDKLALSLISPLPNEQDFAINVCTVLSSEGKHSLKLEKHPRILHYLMAHAAVFREESLKKLFQEFYGVDRCYPLHYFWRDIIWDKEMLKLTNEQITGRMDASTNEVFNCERYAELPDSSLFCLGLSLGTQEFLGQRVTQIATILRNLSFTPDNITLMARDTTFLRFALLCCYSSWNGLAQIGWDMLSNVASEIPSNSPLFYELLFLITRGLLSEDRAVILNSLDILNKLAQTESNENLLLNTLNQEVYDRVCSFLTLHDIMLLVYTLECLNAISSIGEKACNSIVRVHGALDVLVSLITVEAQSYGPKACIQMRVVETVVGNTAGDQSQPGTVTLSVGSATSSITNAVSSAPPQPPTNISSAPLIATLSGSNPTTLKNTQITPTIQQQGPAQSIATSSSSTTSSSSQKVSTSTSLSLNSALATQQVAQENEQFALTWLRNTFEPQNGSSIEQAELYKQYINYCASIGRRGVIAPLHFPRCVRSVFGGSVGPKFNTVGDATQQHYEGINLRSKPLVPSIPNSPSPAFVPNLPSKPSPILKAQLSAPPKPSSQVSPPPTKKAIQRLPQFHPRVIQTAVLRESSLVRSLEDNNVIFANATTKTPTKNSRINGLKNDVPEAKREDTSGKDAIISCESSPNQLLSLTPLSCTNKLSHASALTSCNNLSESPDVSGSSATLFSSKDFSGNKGDPIGGLLNGVQSSVEIALNTTKETTSKNLMLADLLEKSSEKKEPPPLNGALRLVERGLELANAGFPASKKQNGSSSFNNISNKNVSVAACQNLKRTISNSDLPTPKKIMLNGEVKQDSEQGNVSLRAANLYAALAADALDERPMDELGISGTNVGNISTGVGGTPSVIHGPVVMQAGGSQQNQPRQILVATGAALTQRVVVGGQHYVVAQPQTTLVQHGAQTVLLTQTSPPQGTATKTIIILQPQGISGSGSSGGGKVMMQKVIGSPPPTALLSTNRQFTTANHTPTTAAVVSTTASVSNQTTISQQTHTSPQIKKAAASSVSNIVGSSGLGVSNIGNISMPTIPAPCATPVSIIPSSKNCITGSTPAATTITVTPTSSGKTLSHNPTKKTSGIQGHFLCEWRGCMRSFQSGNEVYLHACETHCPENNQEVQCMWDGCDAMKRKRFSLMTHLYDKHCNADVMKMMAVRRKQLSVSGRSEIPAPIPAAPHPGYAPNAAFHAIKRHALEFVNPKELQDDNEGPVTKSIRLTAALILRNLVIYSASGKRYLTRYEPHLANVALSNVESSRTIAHVLFDMNQLR